MKLYSKLIEASLSRSVRLCALTLAIGILFPSVRLAAVGLIYIIVFYYSFTSYRSKRTPYFFVMVTISVLCLMVHYYSYSNYRQVKRYIEENSPLSLDMVADGEYIGTGQGFRSPIKLTVSVQDHKIVAVKLLHYQDSVNGLDEIKNRIGGNEIYLGEYVPKTAFGVTKTASGYQAAVLNALWKGVAKAPTLSPVTQFTYAIIENHFGRTTFNSMAIIFIIILTFDFFLQPVLNKNTGQSLNCYNCQVCVGACPIKMVEGQPFPMTMVLMARLGEYDKVANLARYCVGCGKCAAKCPAGNSGPSVAAACFIASRNNKKRLASESTTAREKSTQESLC
jgi:ferredoxin